MPHFRVVLVEPLNDGNVGAVARSMKNFGLDELVLVRPCAIGEEALKRAMHGMDVLKGARTVFSDDEALKGADFVAATSGVDRSPPGSSPRRPSRWRALSRCCSAGRTSGCRKS